MTKSGLVFVSLPALAVILSLIFGAFYNSPASADTGSDSQVKAQKSSIFSVLGSVFDFFDAKPAYEEVVLPQNIQNLPLLQAPKNIDPQAKSQTPIQVVDDSALSSENIGVNGNSISGTEFKPTSDQISLYVVRIGDTLAEVAEMFDVTPNTIRWANDIGAKESIQPGQVLVILPVAGVKYTVKRGDTISKIAKAYGADAIETANFNNVGSDDTLAVGTTIIIPDGEESIGPAHGTTASVKVAVKVKTGASTAGYFSRPVVGAKRTQGIHGHNGVDLAASLNTPILAAAAGQVIISKSGGWNGGYGTYVVVKHANGTQTLYGHLNQALVSQGDSVVKGQQIGKMGSTGQSTGVHLHFEVRGGTNPF